MIIFWALSMAVMVTFGFLGSIVMITIGYKRKKLGLMLLSFLTFLMVFIPLLGIFVGIDTDQYTKLSNEFYWSIFAF
ncbi:hypothetical protein OMD49_30210 [Bacillus anthracis]|nr:hypothetical protein [Bacillus anthracis]